MLVPSHATKSLMHETASGAMPGADTRPTAVHGHCSHVLEERHVLLFPGLPLLRNSPSPSTDIPRFSRQ